MKMKTDKWIGVLAVIALMAAVTFMVGAGTDINGNRTVEGNLTVKGTCTGCGSSGALVLVTQHAATGAASIPFTDCITSTYNDYQIEMVGITVSAATGININASTNGGMSYDTGSNYDVAQFSMVFNGTASQGGASQTAWLIQNAIDTTANTSANGTFYLHVPASKFAYLYGFSTGHLNGGGETNNLLSGGTYKATGMNAFELVTVTGGTNLATGNVRCYGVAK